MHQQWHKTSYKLQKMEIEKAWKPLQKNHRNKKLSKTRRKFIKKKTQNAIVKTKEAKNMKGKKRITTSLKKKKCNDVDKVEEIN